MFRLAAFLSTRKFYDRKTKSLVHSCWNMTLRWVSLIGQKILTIPSLCFYRCYHLNVTCFISSPGPNFNSMCYVLWSLCVHRLYCLCQLSSDISTFFFFFANHYTNYNWQKWYQVVLSIFTCVNNFGFKMAARPIMLSERLKFQNISQKPCVWWNCYTIEMLLT